MTQAIALGLASALAVGTLFAVPIVASAATAESETIAVETAPVAAVTAETAPAESAPAESAVQVAPAPAQAETPTEPVVSEPVAEVAALDIESDAPDEAVSDDIVESADVVEPAALAVADEGDISILATPTTTDVVVSARIAFQRAPIANVNDPAFLEGVTFELFRPAGPGDSGGPGAATGYTCEFAVGDLDCTISVPDTAPGGENAGDRFYVVMTSAGENATVIPELMTGTSSQPDTLRYYPGLTPALTGGSTVAFPEVGSGQTLNSLVVAAALDNPVLAPSCLSGPDNRLSLGAQMDLSGSVNATQRQQYRDAFEGLVVDLAGQPVDLSIATFGSSSPVVGRAGGPWSLDDPADVEDALDAIAAYTQAVPGATQQTNWDLALRRTADYPGVFDALLMVTDGAPNWISNASGTGGQPVDGSQVTLASIEQAVFSANALKAEGTRVIAMGVGNGLAGPASRNLAAISGPVAGSDYFQGQWETLADDLIEVVTPLVCLTPASATTFVVDADGLNPVATDGFSVTAEVTDVTVGNATVTGDSPQVTGSGSNPTGAANWAVDFDDASASATLTVTQAPRAGFEVTGASWTVTHQDGTTTTGSSASNIAVILGLEYTDSVAVSFVNAPLAATATFDIRKVLTGDAAALVPPTTEFTVDYTVNGVAAPAPLVLTADGTVVSSPALEVGDEIAFSERAPAAIDGIVWGAAPAIPPITLTADPVTVDVVNSATVAGATFQVRKLLAGTGASAVPSTTTFSFAYTVNGVAAASPLVVTAGGSVVTSPQLQVGDVVRITELAPPSVANVSWGAVPVAQEITLAVGGSQVVTFTNTATLTGVLPATGSSFDGSTVFGFGAIALLAGLALIVAVRRRQTQTKA